MSNETKSDKPQPPKDNLTRVPVKHLYFAVDHYADMPGGANQLSNVKCYPDPPEQSRYYTCEFIPAWQVFEVTFHPGPSAATISRCMSASHVKSWERLL